MMHTSTNRTLHTVHVLKGHSRPVLFEMHEGGSFTLTFDYFDRYEDLMEEKCCFSDSGEFHEWQIKKGIELPAAFLLNLKLHCMKDHGHPPMPSPREWHITLDDVLSLTPRQFDVCWRLSSDSPFDGANVESFSTLTEAAAFVCETGALMASPGNWVSILIGDTTLYDARFTSEGIDRGDSHVKPGMKERTADLYDEILAIE